MAGIVSCNECGVFFKSEAHRTRHRLTHSPTRHQCPLCLRLFIRQDSYIRHFKRKHTEKPGSIIPAPIKILIQKKPATQKRFNEVNKLLYKPPNEQPPQYSPSTNWQLPTPTSDLPPIPRSTSSSYIIAPQPTPVINYEHSTIDQEELASMSTQQSAEIIVNGENAPNSRCR